MNGISLGRCDMAQWEAGVCECAESSAYPVLGFEDIQYIIDEEEEGTLLVLCRSLEGEESIIGYSYSYLEPWESTFGEPARPSLTSPRKRRSRVQTGTIASDTPKRKSLYVAELFVSECERGLGLGDLLLTETLKVHADSECGSHLFVSSKNVSAVRCYTKFGFQRGLRPSGDAVHDSVMELVSCFQCVVNAISRYSHQIGEGTIGVRRRRRPLMQLNGKCNSDVTHGALSKSQKLADTGLVCHSPQSGTISDNPKKRFESSKKQAARGKVPSKTNDGEDSEASISPLLPCSDGPQLIFARSTRSKSKEENCCMGQSSVALFNSSDYCLQASVITKCHTMTRRSSRRPRFHLTGMRTSARKLAEDGIRRLGGEVLNTDTYDFSCTHIIASRPVRTEKFLCGLAEGKPLLHPAYIEESLKRGAFLGEAEFEWISVISNMHNGKTSRVGSPALDSFAYAMANSVLRWKEFRLSCPSDSVIDKSPDESNHPIMCFKGIVAMLFGSETKNAGLSRLILAGGGIVVADFQTWRKSKKSVDLQHLTHALVCCNLLDDTESPDMEKWSTSLRLEARNTLAMLRTNGVECLREEFALDLLIDGPNRDIAGYQLQFLSDPCAAAKRKRSQQTNYRMLRSKTSLR